MENEAKNELSKEPVSKSQLKRESQEITKLGKRLAALSAEKLSHIPLDEPVLQAIALARKIQNKRSALKRHYLFLGKLLRARDTDNIFAALERLDQAGRVDARRHHQAELWRDEIITGGDDAIEACLLQHSHADRQKLRQLQRNHHHAKTDARRSQFSRAIYREIFSLGKSE